MLRFAAIATAVVAISACRQSLEDDDGGGSADAAVSPACMEAATYQNLANIESKIFAPSCIFSGCHNGANTDAGRLDLRAGMSHAELVDVASMLDPQHKMVVAGQPNQSYLLLMLGHIQSAAMSPPGVAPAPAIGLMPQNSGGQLLCAQKREAIVRWIMAGAMNN